MNATQWMKTTFARNTATGDQEGFSSAPDSTEGRFTNNIATANTLGMYLAGSFATVRKNLVTNNSDNGLSVVSNGHTQVLLNTATGNAGSDLVDDKATLDCGTNVWKANTFGTANKPCIH